MQKFLIYSLHVSDIDVHDGYCILQDSAKVQHNGYKGKMESYLLCLQLFFFLPKCWTFRNHWAAHKKFQSWITNFYQFTLEFRICVIFRWRIQLRFLLQQNFLSCAARCTEGHFASFFFGGFITAIVKWVHPIMSASNVFHNSHLIQKCIQAADFVYTSESNESCEKHSTQRW